MTDTDTPPGLVAVPAVPWIFTRAAESFMRLAVNLPKGSDLRFLRGGTTIAAKRNEAAHSVVANKGWDWLLQVDSDMTPPPDTAERLWRAMEEAEADAATAAFTNFGAGRCFAHVIPAAMEKGVGNREYARESDDIVEVEHAGGACFMVRREALRQMGGKPFSGNVNNVSEERSFWDAFNDKGFKLVLDLGTEVGHLHVHPFGLGDVVREETIQP